MFPIHRLFVLGAALLAPRLATVARASEAPQVDPQIEPQRETEERMPKVSLQEAVHRAVATHPSIEGAREAVARAAALRAQARASSLPQVAASGSYTRLDSDRTRDGLVFVGRDTVAGSLTAWVPLIHPAAWAAARRATDDAMSARAQAADVARDIAVATARAYLELLAADRIVAAHRHGRDTASALFAIAQRRFGGGLGNDLDRTRAARELASAEALLAGARSMQKRGREALGLLVGTDGPVQVDGEPELLEVAPAQALDEAPRRRRDVAATLVAVQGARRADEDRWSEYFPMLALSGQAFLQTPAYGPQTSAGWQAQAVISVPIYDGGAREGRIAERHAHLRAEEAKLDLQLRSVRSEIRSAAAQVSEAQAAVVAAGAAQTLARRSLELATTAYQAGVTTSLEVIDAERASFEADTQLAQAEDALREGRLALSIAGGSFP